MEALRANNFNVLLKGKVRGRGKIMLPTEGIATNDKLNRHTDNNNNSSNNKNAISFENLNKQSTQFEDIDHDLCNICDRNDGTLFCTACGHSWTVSNGAYCASKIMVRSTSLA